MKNLINMTKMSIFVLLIELTVCVGATVGFVKWWDHNRMILPCVLLGVWGGGGPGFEYHLRRYDKRMDTPKWTYRLSIVGRHEEYQNGSCAPANAEKHWVLVEKLSVEREWAEASFMFSLLLGYGDYYGVAFYNRENGIRNLHPDLGDGEHLDLERSFALLQKSAAQGYYLAQFALGQAYYAGEWGKDGALKIGVDADAAMSWMNKAAAQGDESAGFYIRQYSSAREDEE